MKRDKIEKMAELLNEVKELEKYKEFLKNKEYGDTFHFEVKQHYGSVRDTQKIIISRRHNPRFIAALDKIISEINAELDLYGD